MSGHSKWATNFRAKSAADAKKGAIFTKYANLITVAAREGGGDVDANFKLRLVVDKAREANMPKDNIVRAINKGTGAGKDGVSLEAITYEIVGPGGVGFIVEALTDNKNRTVGELKAIVNKHNCQLGATGAVAWNFNRQGSIMIDAAGLTDDDELTIIDAGAEDIDKQPDEWEVITQPDKLMAVAAKLKDLNYKITEAKLIYAAKEELPIDANLKEQIEKIYGLFDDLDDVTNVFTNATF